MKRKGKTKSDIKVITCCDFGDRNRRTELAYHYTYATAAKAYGKYWNIYYRSSNRLWRVWQEMV